MKILYVTYGLPYPPNSGARVRDYNLIRHVSQEHTVLLLSLLEDPEERKFIPHIEALCDYIDVALMHPRTAAQHIKGVAECLYRKRPLATHAFFYHEMARKIHAAVRNNKIDIIQIEHSFLAPYIGVLPHGASCRKILSFQNLGFLQYRRMMLLKTGALQKVLFFLKWLMMTRWEANYAARFDESIVVSAHERELLLSANPKLSVTEIPNGVDTEQLVPLPPPNHINSLIFAGTMGYPPNIDAMLYFCNRILPLIERRFPDLELFIAGRCPSPEIKKLGMKSNITVTGSVEDIRDIYKLASVCVVPLRAGGGTRLKILEAMALGRPVVSTSLGAEGLMVNNKNIIIADTPESFAKGVIDLLSDPRRRSDISESARKLVKENYDWRSLSNRLIDLYIRTIS